MRLSRSLMLMLGVAAATAGAAVWRWSELGPALEAGSPLLEAAWPVLATAFGGLCLLHLHAVLRLARLTGEAGTAEEAGAADESPARQVSRPGEPGTRRAPETSGHQAERPTSAGARRDVPGRSEPSAPAKGAPPGPTDRPSVERSGAPAPAEPADDPEQVEEFLKVVLDDADAEDVSFLPPYASDQAEEVSFADPYADEATRASAAGAGATGEAGDDGDDGDDGAPQGSADEASDGPSEPYRNVPIPRHFALGTVAIIKEALTPAEVAQVLVEQRKRPREKFGELAVEMDLLTDSDLQALLLAQQQGLFTDEEIRRARKRIKAFRELEANAPAG